MIVEEKNFLNVSIIITPNTHSLAVRADGQHVECGHEHKEACQSAWLEVWVGVGFGPPDTTLHTILSFRNFITYL